MYLKHLYKIYPKKDIIGVLPNNKRIIDPIELELNKKEFIKCTSGGDVYAIVNGEEIFVSGLTYDLAESLFDQSITVPETIEEPPVVLTETITEEPTKVEEVVEEVVEESVEIETDVEEKSSLPESEDVEAVEENNTTEENLLEHLNKDYDQNTQINQSSLNQKNQSNRDKMKASHKKSNKK